MDIDAALADTDFNPSRSQRLGFLLSVCVLLLLALLITYFRKPPAAPTGPEGRYVTTSHPKIPPLQNIARAEAGLRSSDSWVEMPTTFAADLHSLLETMNDRVEFIPKDPPICIRYDQNEPKWKVRLTLRDETVHVFFMDSRLGAVVMTIDEDPKPEAFVSWRDWFPIRRQLCPENDRVEAALKAAIR